MSKPLRVLLVEDSEDDAALLLLELRRGGWAVDHVRVQTAEAMTAALRDRIWDIVISDFSMPQFSALGALDVLKQSGVDLPFIVASGTVGEDSAVEALKAGAHDFIVKGKYERLSPAIVRERREADTRRDLRVAEERLRNAQRMESIGRLAGGIAHDFNNLLSVILSYADVILADLNRDDVLRPDIEEIKRAAVRSADLTRQLLAFSRQQVLEPRVLDLRQILAGMERMLRRLLRADVEVTLLLPPKLGCVRADPSQIEQVLMNLAVNARDAMPSGGQLTLELKNVTLDEDYRAVHPDVIPGPYVMLAVTDSGVGMDDETQAKVFEPFFTTKERGKGTGLGLATVFGIVKQSSGHVWLYSEPGRGSTFKIYLPRVDAPPEHIDRPSASDRPTNGSETILLVEDDEQVRIVSRNVLRRAGYRVLEAPNGGEAILLAEQHDGPIHLLLADVVLPRMGGPAVAERIRTSRPDIKVLFMSGYTDEAVFQHGILDSGAAYLQKPLTPDRLLRRVRDVLTGIGGPNG